MWDFDLLLALCSTRQAIALAAAATAVTSVEAFCAAACDTNSATTARAKSCAKPCAGAFATSETGPPARGLHARRKAGLGVQGPARSLVCCNQLCLLGLTRRHFAPSPEYDGGMEDQNGEVRGVPRGVLQKYAAHRNSQCRHRKCQAASMCVLPLQI